MVSHYLTPFGAKGSSGTIVAQNHDLNGTEIIGGLHQGDYSKSCYLIPLGKLGTLSREGGRRSRDIDYRDRRWGAT